MNVMAKYRKKPVVIDAFQFGLDPVPEWFSRAVISGHIRHQSGYDFCEITTLEGLMVGRAGDFIIRGLKGEFYPCKSDIFHASYEVVPQEST